MIQLLGFPDASRWRAWLARNHRRADGVWLKIAKKGSLQPSVTYAEALDEALCFGWIDGQKKSHDAQAFLQKFTPRRPRSIWSKRNIVHCERLVAAGRMQPAGQAQIDAAKADGRWDQAYDPPSRARRPPRAPRLPPPPPPPHSLTTSCARWPGTAGPGSSSSASTGPTATPSPGGCRPRSAPRRGCGGWRPSCRCWPREGRSTREQVPALPL